MTWVTIILIDLVVRFSGTCVIDTSLECTCTTTYSVSVEKNATREALRW